MTEGTKSGNRYFFLSFSIAFLVLSFLLYLLMNAIRPDVPPSLRDAPGTVETESYLPSRDEALSVLFVGIAPDSSEADTFILARFDPARGKVPIVVFPVHTAVQNNGRTETLAEVYRYGGADYTRGVLARTLGIPIDRYVRMSVSSFIIAADAVGTVEFDLAHEIVVGGEGAIPMTLDPGVRLLDGETAAEIIHYGEYAGGELTRCAIIADLTAAIVNQRIDIVLSTVADKVFEKVVNLVDTDISYADYEDRKQAAAFLARLGQDPAAPLDVSGRYSSDGKEYVLSDTFAALLTQTFV